MTQLTKQNLLSSGKTKSLYTCEDERYLIAEFRDDTTAFNAGKFAKLANKGRLNNLINAHIMQVLTKAGIPTHFERLLSDNEALVKRLRMIPLESVVRNIAAGSLCKRLGVEANQNLNPALYELFLKNDDLGDPLVNDNHAISFGWAQEPELNRMRELTLAINDILTPHFAAAGLILVDAKYEFGVLDGEVLLGDEISPDSCRIWDANTRKILDKDRFRQDLGGVVSAYQEVAMRLGIELELSEAES